MAAKYRRARGEISLFSAEKENFEDYAKDDMDLDKANNKYLLQFGEAMGRTSNGQLKMVIYLFIT